MRKTPPAPPDKRYRDQIASDLDQTLLVEAAAGTGKTTCLISRMVGLLSEGKCQVETLAAVTFTRKAAAELRARFQLALEKAVHNSSGQTCDRLTAALRHVERCFIGTIHSFCARLLRERPVEAGVDPGFVELDEVLDEQLRRQAWQEHVAALISTDDPVLPELERLGLKVSPATIRSTSLTTELDELGLVPAELGPAFLRYAEYSDVDDWPAEPVPMPDVTPCIDELRRYAAHMRGLALPADHGNDKLMPKYELIGRMVQRLDLNQPAQLMEVLEQFESDAKVVQKQWPSGKSQALAEQDRWKKFASQYADPLLLAWREHRYEPVMRAIRPARHVYDRLRRERNGLNFQDLLVLSAALLRDKPEVRRYFRERFTHLLVDEFQDTDPIQAEVMLLLTADDANQTDWEKCRPVAGSLFVVGDPKQSIYRFRRADILTYNKVREIVHNVGGLVIPLTANFRSVEPLVKWVNHCFSQVFPATADDFNPSDRPLEVGRAHDVDTGSAVERLDVQSDSRRNDEVAELEAAWIARTVRRAIDEKWPVPRSEEERQRDVPEHAQPGDFLIVAKTKSRLSIYARLLQQYGIPHVVTGGSVLNEVPELELLYLCLSAVNRSDDPIALVSLLRSELFGIADTVLYDFHRLEGRFSYTSEVPAKLPAADAALFADAFERLRLYAGWLRRMPVAAAVERIAAHLGLIARAGADKDGATRAGSLLKVIELLRSMDRHHGVGSYVDALGRLVEQTDRHDGVSVRPHDQTPVRVMNLHQCKGLEAPFLFLVDPGGETEHDVGIHIDRSADKPRGYLAIYGPKRNQWTRPPVLAQPRGWSQLAAREQQFLEAELKRLLYVAATRAGIKLVISQREGSANQKNPWRRFDEYLPTTSQFAEPGPITLPSSAPFKFDGEQWSTELVAIENRWQVVGRPTYSVESIKSSVIKGGAKPHGAEEGGAAWGTLLHTLLDAAMKRPNADLRGLAMSALAAEDLPPELADEAVLTVKRVVASPLWQRAATAAQRLVEVFVAIPITATDSTSGLPTVFRGVIDLVFRDRGGWVIVDYKSERVPSSDIPALVAYYKPQIDAYSDVWQKIVGQPVVERGLFFTHSGEYVTI